MDTVRKRVQKAAKEKPFLPDEIIRNILIRLPVKSVMRCALVCRIWRDIILARYFVDLHLKNSNTPLILVTISKHLSLLRLFGFDNWWELANIRLRFMIRRFPFNTADFPKVSYALFSHAGLIVIAGHTPLGPRFVILNPIRPSLEYVTITLSQEFCRSIICALYYHPLLKEYCCLWKIEKSTPFNARPEPIEYKLLNLGFNPLMRTISNPFNHRFSNDNSKPLFIGNYLYWMLKPEQTNKHGGHNDILSFDIVSEEFIVISCPVPLNIKCESHQTHLVSIDGILSFVLILSSLITIWRLEDHLKQVWTSTEYTISLDSHHCKDGVGIISIVNGKLAFQWKSRLFVCNLMEVGSVKNYPKRKYSGDVSFFSHHMSLASLKNCESDLYINKDFKVLLL